MRRAVSIINNSPFWNALQRKVSQDKYNSGYSLCSGARCLASPPGPWPLSVTERPDRAPAPLKQGAVPVWQPPNLKEILSLKERLSKQAALWREQAKALPPGYGREELLRKAQQTSVAAALNEWLTSPSLQQPK